MTKIERNFGKATDTGKPSGSRPARFTSNIVGPIYFVADLASLLLAAPIAYFAYQLAIGERVNANLHLTALLVMVFCFMIIRTSKDGYRKSFVHLALGDENVLLDAFISVFLTAAIIWQLGLIAEYSRGVSILYLVAFSTLLMISRWLVGKLIDGFARQGWISQRIAIYGADRRTFHRIEELTHRYLPHVRFVGIADDRPKQQDLGELTMIGGFDDLAELARRGEVDQVMVYVPELNKARMKEIADGFSQVSIDVSVIPAQAIEFAPDYRVNLLGSLPVLTLWQRPFRDLNRVLKRIEDFVVASIALVLLSPVLLVTALLIKLTSNGPVLFVQPRVGFNNELINVYKFRSMYQESSDLHANRTTTKDDDRVTPVGKVIRRLSIDELPQLINVLGGSMSIVGPRPHATQMRVGDRFYQDAVAGYAGRHRVKPGMTGLAQVRGLRGEIRTIERARRRVELDKEYIDSWSVWLDFKIMLMTVRAVLFDADAY